jgi:diguanylate cyclase (GGDEF)-like protein/PAS domain S-box-containing protein
MHPDDVTRVEETVAEQWNTGREEPVEYRVRHRDGSWRSVEALITNLFDEPGIAGVVGTMRDITERKEVEAALAATRERFAALALHASDLVTVTGGDSIMTYVSPSAKHILGYEPAELEGTDARLLNHPDDAAALLDTVMTHIKLGGEPPPVSYRIRHRDGSWRTFEGVSTNLLDEPSVQGVVSNLRDVTERVVAEQKAAQLTAILEASDEVVVLSDTSGRVVYANQTARVLLGPHEDGDVSELSSLESRERLRTEIMPTVRRDGVWSGELELIGCNDACIPVAATIQAHRDEAGDVELIATIAHDISALKAAQDRLEHEATHDSLTGLPNRVLFREIGERALARSSRANTAIAVLFLDLDGFKLVNDGYGHDTGDQLLAQVARRLREVVRLGDTVARLGGDEFVVLCEQPESEAHVLDVSRRLIDVVSAPFFFDEFEVRVGASVGIAFGGDTDTGIAGLIREADIALYRAKHDGRGRAELFDDSLDTSRRAPSPSSLALRGAGGG